MWIFLQKRFNEIIGKKKKNGAKALIIKL